MKKVAYLFSIILFLSSCQSSNDEAKDELIEGSKANANEMMDQEINLDMADFKSFKASIAYPDAEIAGYTYDEHEFSFDVPEGDYELGVQTADAETKMCANSAKGQHIHLIMNNEPYAAKYTADFDYELSNGEHYLLAFLSRSYHESIKTKNAHVADKIVVQNGGIESKTTIKEPMLFYSRPKGTYVGESETKRIMLDFYLVNTTLGNDRMVKVEVNANDPVYINKWEPHYLDGLPMGENTVKLTLVDGQGNKIDVPLNPVSRTFTLKADPMEKQG